MQLATKAATTGDGSTHCAAEELHAGFRRQLLGVLQSTLNAVALAETGEWPPHPAAAHQFGSPGRSSWRRR